MRGQGGLPPLVGGRGKVAHPCLEAGAAASAPPAPCAGALQSLGLCLLLQMAVGISRHSRDGQVAVVDDEGGQEE